MIGLIGSGTPLGASQTQNKNTTQDTLPAQTAEKTPEKTTTAPPQSARPAEEKAPAPAASSSEAKASPASPPQSRLAPESAIRVQVEEKGAQRLDAEAAPATASNGKLDSMRKALAVVTELAEQPTDSRIAGLFESKAPEKADGADAAEDAFSAKADAADTASEPQESVDRYL